MQNIFNQNNVYEQLNCKFEDMLKCIRGPKPDDAGLTRLIIIYHTFFRKHTGLRNNMTSAKAIRTDIMMPMPDSNLAFHCNIWITFIENAAVHAKDVSNTAAA